MSCYRPIAAWRDPSGSGVTFVKAKGGDRLDLPCGRCIGCLSMRAQEWASRVMHEAQMWPRNCFVTLTYGRDKLPPDGSLCYRDFQLFLKRLRKAHGKVRFFMCGEYGPLNLRPHYHACLFNVDFDDKVVFKKSAAGAVCFSSPQLDSLWTHGACTVQELNSATALYCAKYIVKAASVDSAGDRAFVDVDSGGNTVAREFSRCSLRPGIGAEWFKRFGSDVYPHDYVVRDGRKFKPPRYYDKLERRRKGLSWDEIEFARQQRAKGAFADSSEERLRVREVVHFARVRNQKRVLE